MNVESECARTLLLADLLCLCSEVGYPTCIVGDFNFPLIDWPTLSVKNNEANHNIFLDACVRNALSQSVQFETHTAGNILDLILSNDESLVLDVAKSEPFVSTSDHFSVDFVLDFVACPRDNTVRYFRNFRKADYAAINGYLSDIDWNALVTNCQSPEQLYFEICQINRQCIEKFVPLCKMSNRKNDYPPVLRRLIARKRRLFRFSKRSKIGKNLYNKCAKIYEESVRDFHDAKESAIVDSGNIKSFYNYANKKLKNRHDIAPLKRADGSFATDNLEKAEILQSQFGSVFSADDNSNPAFDKLVDKNVGLNSVAFPVDTVLKKLRKLPAKCSQTPDGIPAVFWKNVADNVAFPLSRLFEMSIAQGKIPDVWKEAIVVPIFKKGLPSEPKNYRPISLLSIVSKLMESIIADAVLKYLRLNHLISKDQFGFLSKRSTGLQLLTCLNDWTKALRDKRLADVVYIDYAKAFDTVSHNKLITKLEGYGIGYELLFCCATICQIVSKECVSTRPFPGIST